MTPRLAASHTAGTAKQLAEDGIDPRTRLRFLPIAVRWHGWGPSSQLHAAAGPLLHLLAMPSVPCFLTGASPLTPTCRPRRWRPAAPCVLGWAFLRLAAGSWPGCRRAAARFCRTGRAACMRLRGHCDLPACAHLVKQALCCIRNHALQYKEIAEVSSWDDALALAKQQRVREGPGGCCCCCCCCCGAACALCPCPAGFPGRLAAGLHMAPPVFAFGLTGIPSLCVLLRSKWCSNCSSSSWASHQTSSSSTPRHRINDRPRHCNSMLFLTWVGGQTNACR